ncbi:hypothetical protein V499_00264 [Pseudogymnoascus sp. VKM F-103]|uniref:Sorbose reductase sou1 n=1 Tax=Pseudogymnoascus verrucosus TaxID=342668 RepID=A0A2P2SX85_9PEZI|nr:Sorbose reductase sou1 [Pseudogymnoascus verrucosus]KFY80931.1 hypothetical protein V499_00264 [Pseudogymnoascus sp. VKM F-103]OBT38993.1 hypothetical protein VE00_10361 [Pseudogymnoascus sp. WSF 3629]OBU01478.1 Sorbose reductase sou1 [Pseudogymnoascus verrucosus]
MSRPIFNGGDFVHNNTVAQAADRILPLFSLKGRTAIVTGAASGIGHAVVQALAESGANVAFTYNSNKDKAIEGAKAIEKTYNVQCRAYKLDVTAELDIEETINQIVREFNGRLDVFVANSGVPWLQGDAVDGDTSHYRKVMATNLDGVFFCARAAGKHWRRQAAEGTTMDGNNLAGFKQGSFIATASMCGHVVNIPLKQAPYNASKAAVIHLCKSLAVEWVGFARCNIVSPGYVASEVMHQVPEELLTHFKNKTPMGRLALPGEMKGAYLYLASDASSFATGTDIIVDGGYSVT